MEENNTPKLPDTPPEKPAAMPAEPPSSAASPADSAPGSSDAPKSEAPPKPTAKKAVKAAAKAPAEMQAEPWDGELATALQARFGDTLRRAATYREQDFLEADAAVVPELLRVLRDEFDYEYLVEQTAVDYPKDDKRFELIYIVYSFSSNHYLRIKTRVAEGEKMGSVVSIFESANWMEREIFDMFGVVFADHPDLRRILMPDEWEGFPLRKDYDIIQQDTRWVQENLEIESGQ
jgi:NADH-quinone oxidoreductase subunit C